MSDPSGRHFLQIPGPTNVPDRVLRAIQETALAYVTEPSVRLRGQGRRPDRVDRTMVTRAPHLEAAVRGRRED
jgi:hypothetical protein